MPAAWAGRRVFLHFAGVESAFYAWVNGARVGYSEDSRTPAEFDIMPHLRPGRNILAVEVYRWSDGSHLECPDFRRLSGFFRDVHLFSTPPVHIRDFELTGGLIDDYPDGTVRGRAWVRNYRDRAAGPLAPRAEEAIPLSATVAEPRK